MSLTLPCRVLLFALFLLALSTASSPAQVRISVAFGPPALPVYEQPECPGDDYIWTPGYWAWDGDDYYWVPGTWVLAPEVGFLWTPPYWAFEDGAYIFYDGYWGPHVGFYGGIVYGFGYFGFGFVGGRWDGGHFFYNRAVTRIDVHVHNVYEERVDVREVNRVSYNGGPGGINARPRPEDEVAARERHIPPVEAQKQHFEAARANQELRASANHGKPPVAATVRPGDFREHAVAAREAGGPYNRPANRGGGSRPMHVKDLPAPERPAAPNTGDAKRDRKLQQQQDKMLAKQEQERQRLQQQQEIEHQRLDQQKANDARRQQVEQRHQQQTEQLQQRHEQQRQQMQQRMQPPRRK